MGVSRQAAGEWSRRSRPGEGSRCRSGEFNELLGAAGARHVYTRPFSPWQNGEAERMNRAVAREWRYARAHAGEAERAEALRPTWSNIIGTVRSSACGGLLPMSRIVGVNNLSAHNS